MNGKGDKRRPQNVSDETFKTNWDRIFRVHRALKDSYASRTHENVGSPMTVDTQNKDPQ